VVVRAKAASMVKNKRVITYLHGEFLKILAIFYPAFVSFLVGGVDHSMTGRRKTSSYPISWHLP
jgi:hypothetical protein